MAESDHLWAHSPQQFADTSKFTLALDSDPIFLTPFFPGDHLCKLDDIIARGVYFTTGRMICDGYSPV